MSDYNETPCQFCGSLLHFKENCPQKPDALKPYFQDDLTTIYHGDCRSLVSSLPVGLTVTDPPYNVGYHYKTYADNLTVADYQSLLLATCPPPCVLVHYAEDLCALSWTLEDIPNRIVAWVYPSNTARQWRGIAWWGCGPDFSKDTQPYRNLNDKRIQERMANGKSARIYDWWEINQVKNVSAEKTEHPCQIPEAVMTRIIKITDGDLIIDPFMGSGTTLIAARRLSRKSIGIDIDESYCELAAKRIQAEASAPKQEELLA